MNQPIDSRFQGNLPESDKTVITGMGAICGFGNTVGEIMDTLHHASGHFGAVRPVEVREIKTDLHPQLAKSMGKHLSLLLASAVEAHRHCRLDTTDVAPEDIGFFAGMGMVDYRIDELLPAVLKSISPEGDLDYDKFFSGGYREIYPLWVLAMLNNVAFCQIAIHLGIRGENGIFCPHADAGVLAVAEAVKALREGKARAALAGGVGEEISALSVARAGLHGVLGPAGLPFLGECGATLVLEQRVCAEQRGTEPIAAIAGFGFACEKDIGANCPTRAALDSAMDGALLDAGLQPPDIDLVISGAGGTPGMSSWEIEAAREFFSRAGGGPIILSTGRILGETFAAGPILNTVIGACILGSQSIPPILAAGGPPNGGVAVRIRRILVVATSYEGPCASLIIERI